MEEIIKLIADNGIAVMSFAALLYFMFTDKKTTNENQKETNRVLDEISKTLVQLSERVSRLENKKKVKDDE